MICDFHVHTCYSYDSTSLPKQVVETAIKKNIDCLAITDHNETRGALETASYALGKSILIIPGIEIKSTAGDILGLNIKEKIPDRLSPEETIARIKQQDGMVVIPHPFSIFYGFRKNLKDFLNNIDALEVLNGSLFSFENKRALDFAKKNNFCFTAGSDAHFPELIGRAYFEIPGQNLSIGQVFEAIKNKEVKILGKETNIFEKVIEHTKRNMTKLKILKKPYVK